MNPSIRPPLRSLANAYIKLGKTLKPEHRLAFQHRVRALLNDNDQSTIEDLIELASCDLVQAHMTWAVEDAAITQKSITLNNGKAGVEDQVLVVVPITLLGDCQLDNLTLAQIQDIEALGLEQGYLPKGSRLHLAPWLFPHRALRDLGLMEIHQLLHEIVELGSGSIPACTLLSMASLSRFEPGQLPELDDESEAATRYAIGVLRGPEKSLGRRWMPEGQLEDVDVHAVSRQEDTFAWCLEVMRMLTGGTVSSTGRLLVGGLYRYIDGLDLGVNLYFRHRLNAWASRHNSRRPLGSLMVLEIDAGREVDPHAVHHQVSVTISTVEGELIDTQDVLLRPPYRDNLILLSRDLQDICDHGDYLYDGIVHTSPILGRRSS